MGCRERRSSENADYQYGKRRLGQIDERDAEFQPEQAKNMFARCRRGEVPLSLDGNQSPKTISVTVWDDPRYKSDSRVSVQA